MNDEQRYAKKFAEWERTGKLPMSKSLRKRVEQLNRQDRFCYVHPGTHALNTAYDLEKFAKTGEQVRRGGDHARDERDKNKKWTPEQIRKYFRVYHELHREESIRNLASIIAAKLTVEGDALSVETIRRHTKLLRKELTKRLGQ